MSDAIWIALLTSIPGTIAAIGSLIVVIRTARKVDQVHTATDGMKDALVAAARRDGVVEGHAEGVADEKREPGASDNGPTVTKPKSKRKTT